MLVRIAVSIVAKLIHIDHSRGEIGRQMSMMAARWMIVMSILVMHVF